VKIEKFEDIVAWQKARELTKDIYELTSIDKFEKDFSLKDQIRRCSISIASNIAEGFERGGNKEFIHFLYIAKGSCAELRAQLYIASDLLYINDVEFNNAYNKAIEINKLLYGFISYLKNSNLKGDKFK
jgi:four helix bundle protein